MTRLMVLRWSELTKVLWTPDAMKQDTVMYMESNVGKSNYTWILTYRKE